MLHRLQSSLPVIHKVGKVGIVVLLKFENKLDVVITQQQYQFHFKAPWQVALDFSADNHSQFISIRRTKMPTLSTLVYYKKTRLEWVKNKLK